MTTSWKAHFLFPKGKIWLKDWRTMMQWRQKLHLTVKERNEEKRVPSSYLEILANTPSRMATNWETEEDSFWVSACEKASIAVFNFNCPVDEDVQMYLCNQELDHVPHTFLNEIVDLGGELFLKTKISIFNKQTDASGCKPWPVVNVLLKVCTSWPISIAHNLADWSLASTMTLNMVHNVGEMRKSVDLLLFVSLDSNAILVLQCKWNI